MTYPARSAGAAPFPPTNLHPLAGRTVLQIVPDLEAGGAERTTLDVAAGLAQVGAQALVATEGGRLVAELQAKGGIWVPFPAAVKNPASMLLNVRRLARLCHDEGVALVHARSRAPAWVALGAARSLDLPFVTTYHGAYAGRSKVKRLYNSVMARGDAVIANSHYTANLVRSLYPKAAGRIGVIYRGTDFAVFSPSAVAPSRSRRCAGPGASRRTSASCCSPPASPPGRATRCCWRRPPCFATRAWGHRVRAGRRSAGPQRLRPRSRRLVAERRLGDMVRRVGHCADMPAAFLAASVVAAPSTEPEAFGRSAVEAMAMGAPVVVSDLGAVPETVLAPPEVSPHERTGWRVPPGDPQALADAVGAALSLGASARGALAAKARAHVERHFSLERMVVDTLDLYAALLKRPRPS